MKNRALFGRKGWIGRRVVDWKKPENLNPLEPKGLGAFLGRHLVDTPPRISYPSLPRRADFMFCGAMGDAKWRRGRDGGREKVAILLILSVICRVFSPPVSFADSPLLRGGLIGSYRTETVCSARSIVF